MNNKQTGKVITFSDLEVGSKLYIIDNDDKVPVIKVDTVMAVSTLRVNYPDDMERLFIGHGEQNECFSIPTWDIGESYVYIDWQHIHLNIDRAEETLRILLKWKLSKAEQLVASIKSGLNSLEKE